MTIMPCGNNNRINIFSFKYFIYIGWSRAKIIFLGQINWRIPEFATIVIGSIPDFIKEGIKIFGIISSPNKSNFWCRFGFWYFSFSKLIVWLELIFLGYSSSIPRYFSLLISRHRPLKNFQIYNDAISKYLRPVSFEKSFKNWLEISIFCPSNKSNWIIISIFLVIRVISSWTIWTTYLKESSFL